MKAFILVLMVALSFGSSAHAVTGYQGNMIQTTTTIANAAQSSAAVNLAGFTLAGVFIPSAFTGTTITFEVSDTLAGTYVPLKSTTSGTALSYTVAVSGYYALDPVNFQGVQFLKVKSGSAEGAARTLILSLKGF